MTAVDELWFLADRAAQQAEQTYHTLSSRYDSFILAERTDRVSRPRFRTLADRIVNCGAPYGAHTIVYNRIDGGSVLLVYHDRVDKWVLPGGEIDDGETYREAAVRELHEEAGIDATYEGLTMLTRVTITTRSYQTWGVLPVFAAQTDCVETTVSDPDNEITAAKWFSFSSLPEETRDRSALKEWWDGQKETAE